MKQYGRFNESGSEYIIEDQIIPRKWNNFLWNDNFLCEIEHDGCGKSFYRHKSGLRSDLIKGKRCIFIRDDEKANYWSFPGSGNEDRTVHGLGYTVFSKEKEGLSASFKMTVPGDIKGEAWIITLTNNTNKKIKRTVFTFAELELAGYLTPFGCKWSIPVTYNKDLNGFVFINNDAYCPDDNFHAFMITDTEFKAFETVPEKFYGIGRGLGNPIAVERGSCESTFNCGSGEYVGVLQYEIELEPGASKEISIIYGVFEELEEAYAVKKKYHLEGKTETALEEVKNGVENYLEGVEINTPDNEINRLFNLWVKHNLKLTAQWTRVYSRGFRDTLQDTAGITSLDTTIARENILESMTHIFKSGRCVRAWGAISGVLKDEFYADGPVWIPLAVNAYICETGDISILDEICEYQDGGKGTVLEHMTAAIKFLYNDKGEHGLSLIHDGDWCDTAHLLGKKGKGEGIWLTIALFNAIKEVIKLAEYISNDKLKAEMEEMSEWVKATVNIEGWDGNWFLIAYNDDGRKIGSNENKEGKVFLNPQSWAVISGITSPEREKQCLEAIDEHLDTWLGPLLLTPAFTSKDMGIGTLSGYHPGTIENGSCYCHAASFKIVADCIAGRGNKAYETMKKIMPGGSADAQNPIADCPPYAFTNCRFAPDHPYLAGRTLGTWLTGTVSWAWQAMTEWMLGVRRTFNGLLIDPCVPEEWSEFSIRRKFRGSVYNVTVLNPEHVQRGVKEIYLDGELYNGTVLPLTTGKIHEVKVIMG